MDRAPAEHRYQQRGEHADAVADGCARQRRRRAAPRLHPTELMDLGSDRAVRVDDALGIRRRARCVGDECRRARVDGRRHVERIVRDEIGEPDEIAPGGIADHGRPFEIGKIAAQAVEIREEVLMAEAVGGHERLHARLAEDVPDLLGTVEVHDRHDHRAQERRCVERRGGLHPVRQLERDDVTRSDAA